MLDRPYVGMYQRQLCADQRTSIEAEIHFSSGSVVQELPIPWSRTVYGVFANEWNWN
jgi:hypothetical protein